MIKLERPELNKREMVSAVCHSLIAFLGYEISLDQVELGNNYIPRPLLGFFEGYVHISPYCIFLLPVFLLIFLQIREAGRKAGGRFYTLTAVLPALLFAFFMVVGYSFDNHEQNWYLLTGLSDGQFLKAGFKYIGLFLLYLYGINGVYLAVDRYGGKLFSGAGLKEPEKPGILFRLYRFYDRKPFTALMLLYLIIGIPYILFSFPAIFMGDTSDVIVQMFPQLGTDAFQYITYFKDHLLDPNVMLNSHHPVFYTLYVHFCLMIGVRLFGSATIGIFIYSMSQFLAWYGGIAYGITFLKRELHVSDQPLLLVALYYLIHPRITYYAFVVTKDPFYAIFLLLFIIEMCRILNGNPGKKSKILSFLYGLLLILLRTDGKYVVLLFFLLFGILDRRNRKYCLASLVGAALFIVLVFKVLYPMAHITPGSTREKLSVPFQQTARYVMSYPDEVTQEEHDAIDRVLDYDVIQKDYEAKWSVPVKDTYREDATKEDLRRYFAVWLEMFKKHPEVYLQATISNYYEYFYPARGAFKYDYFTQTRKFMEFCNQQVGSLGYHFSGISCLDGISYAYEQLRESFAEVPLLGFLMRAVTYTWTMIVLLAMAFRKKNVNLFLLILIPLLTIAVCLIGPRNGSYGRYTLPLIYTLPILILMALHEIKKEKTDEK